MSTLTIHPTAIVDPSAELGEGCEIGPYCIIGPGVTLGAGCWLQHHVTLQGPSRIGSGNRFYAYTSIGQQTQDLKYAGEPTHLEVGDSNTFREFVTVNRGTAPGAYTRIGSGGNFLAYSHVAHDCTVGNRVIFSNNGTIAGHVEVGDFAVIGGLTAVHQFCRIGAHAITGGCSKIVQDVPPFTIADGNPAAVRGLNKVGLERHGFSAEAIRELKEAYRVLFRGELNLRQAVEQLQPAAQRSSEVRQLVDFIEASRRGVLR
ncbi:MAG: acyl-ACP--UDP-N-acetylglucosamine O-acyltransferase [Verrucomicrobiota bacterium]